MSVDPPVVPGSAGIVNFIIEAGATFDPLLLITDEVTGEPIDIVTGLIEARSQFRVRVGAEDFMIELTDTNGRIIIFGEIEPSTAITTALLADGVIVASAAAFITNGVIPDDFATVAGQTGSNNGEFKILSVDSETQITVDTTFTPEAATGTVVVNRKHGLQLLLNALETAPLFDGVYDIELEYPANDVDRLLAGCIVISPNVTRPVIP